MSVLEKAADLIDCLGRADEAVSLAFINTELGMPKSSTHRLLRDLTRLGIARRTEDGQYSLGPRLLYWGEAAAEKFDLRIIAEPTMRRLRDEVGESVHLYLRDQTTRVCIAAVEARHELRPFVQLGRPLPLHVGAAGKVLLAFADDKTQEEELRRATSDARSFPDAPGVRLNEELKQIRSKKWATSIGERESGVAAAAAPIFDSRDRVVAALCVSGPSSRLLPDRLAEVSAPLQRTAGEISALLRRG